MKQFLLIIIVTVISISSSIGNSDNALFPYPTDPEISIFPNPATNYFELKNAQDVKQVVIYSLLGSQIKSYNAADQHQFDVMDLPQGMYLVQLLDGNQVVVATRRLSKE